MLALTGSLALHLYILEWWGGGGGLEWNEAKFVAVIMN